MRGRQNRAVGPLYRGWDRSETIHRTVEGFVIRAKHECRLARVRQVDDEQCSRTSDRVGPRATLLLADRQVVGWTLGGLPKKQPAFTCSVEVLAEVDCFRGAHEQVEPNCSNCSRLCCAYVRRDRHRQVLPARTCRRVPLDDHEWQGWVDGAEKIRSATLMHMDDPKPVGSLGGGIDLHAANVAGVAAEFEAAIIAR
jgi:hypothetical protein